MIQAAVPQTRKATQMPASAYKLREVNVKGSTRYTQQEILAAAGLELGQQVSDDDFKRAAQQLGETGAFSDVAYSFQFAPDGTKLEWTLQDNGQLVPAKFDNFVWFTDDELKQRLRTRVPLFDGRLPATGGLADQISDALQAMLLERKLPGHADYMRAAVGEDAITAVVFSVSNVDIQIRKVGFTGAGPKEVPALEKAAVKIVGQAYQRSILQVESEKDLLPVYEAQGYLKATVGDAQPTVVEQNADTTVVDVTFPVDPGRQYTLTGVTFSGNTAFPTDRLKAFIHEKTAEPANAVALSEDVEQIRRLYRTKGYMAAEIQTVPAFDEEKSAASFDLTVHEGDVYHMGDLDVRGLDDRTASKVDYLWELRGGAVYDASYFKRFVPQLKDVIKLGDWEIHLFESVNAKDHTVDVTLHFDPHPRG